MFNKPSRNHISIIPEQIGAVGVIVLTFLFSALYEALTSGHNIISTEFLTDFISGLVGHRSEAVLAAAGAAVVLILLVPVWLLVRWYKTVFYIDGEYLVCERRTLLKKDSRLPLSSISTVNLERNIFERVVGTAKVKLDINSAATANKTDFTFVLSLEKAKAFEAALLSAKETQADCVGEGREAVCCFTAAQAVRHVLLSQPVVQYLCFAGALVLGIAIDNRLLGGQMFIQLSSLVGLSVLGWAAGVVMQLLSVWNFRVERDEKSIFISSGLLKKKSYSFETEKINALTVRRPLLARMAGLYSAEVTVIGLGNDKKETPQISLLVNKRELDRILSVCAGDFACTGEKIGEHRCGIIPSLVYCLAVSAAVAAFAALVWLPLGVAIFAAGAVFAFFSHRAKLLGADERIFSYSHGFLSKKTCFFKYADIQTVSFCTNVFMRHFGLGRIRLSVLSASAMSVHTTGWFGAAHFESLEKKIMEEPF